MDQVRIKVVRSYGTYVNNNATFVISVTPADENLILIE